MSQGRRGEPPDLCAKGFQGLACSGTRDDHVPSGMGVLGAAHRAFYVTVSQRPFTKTLHTRTRERAARNVRAHLATSRTWSETETQTQGHTETQTETQTEREWWREGDGGRRGEREGGRGERGGGESGREERGRGGREGGRGGEEGGWRRGGGERTGGGREGVERGREKE